MVVALGKRQRKTTESLSTDSGVSGKKNNKAGPNKRPARKSQVKPESNNSSANVQLNDDGHSDKMSDVDDSDSGDDSLDGK
jgi:hypothetical protein